MKGLAVALLLATPGQAAEDWGLAARPMYRGIEAVADAAYGIVRGHLFSGLLPGRLSRRMSAVPAGTSEDVFVERLRLRQERAARRILESRPATGSAGPAALSEWERAALRHQTTAVTDALADALVRRYQLERFGRDSGSYASELANWNAEFVTSAALLGGAYLYAAGLRADWGMGPLRVDFDTSTGAALRGALEGGEGRGLAALTLSRRGGPLSLKTEWGLRSGRLASERVGLNYSIRF